MGIVIGFVVVLFVPICILLTLTILLQDSKGSGLSSSAFGASEMQSILGGRGAATFLTRVTTGLAIGFIVLSLFLMRFYGDVKTGELKPLETGQTQEASLTGEESDQAADTADGEASDAADDTAEPPK